MRTPDPGHAFVPFALERWFAEQQRGWTVDLSPSGAEGLALDELLELATDTERASVEHATLGYGPADGSDELRDLIARRYENVRPDQVIVTCGAIEALHAAISAIVRPGDEIVVQRPMYPAAAGIARSIRARAVTWDLGGSDGYELDLRSLEQVLTPATRLVAVAQPNNPTGCVLSGAEIDELVDLLSPLGIWLLSDEVYRDLPLEPELTVASAAGRYSRAICIGDVAKPFGLGGLRIGWAVAADEDLRRGMRERRDYTTLSVPTLSDVLARVALRRADQLLSRPVANARENLRALKAAALGDHRFELTAPRAGLCAFIGPAGAAALQRRLAAAGVLVVPGDLFDCPDRLRVWLGGSPDEFALALDRMAALMDPAAVGAE